jgi:hypothetical protein
VVLFFKRYGYPPKSVDWEVDDKYPSPHTVKNHFGSWNNLIKEAGFEPRPQHGKHYCNRKLLLQTLTEEAYYDEEDC